MDRDSVLGWGWVWGVGFEEVKKIINLIRNKVFLNVMGFVVGSGGGRRLQKLDRGHATIICYHHLYRS